jgi:hypothetical protein
MNAKIAALSAVLVTSLLSGCAAPSEESGASSDALVGNDAPSAAADLFALFGSTVSFQAPGVPTGKLRANALVTCLPGQGTGVDCTLNAYWVFREQTEEGPRLFKGVTSYTKTGVDADKLYAAMRTVPELGADGTVAETGAKRAVLDCTAVPIFPEQGRHSPVRDASCSASSTVTGMAAEFEWADIPRTVLGDKAATLFAALEGVNDVAQQGGTLRSASIVVNEFSRYELWINGVKTVGDASSVPGQVWSALSDVPATWPTIPGKAGLLTCLKLDAGVKCTLRRAS